MAKPNRVTELPQTEEIKFDAARPDQGAGHADTEGALERLERFLASWSSKNPPPRMPAPVRAAPDGGRQVSGAGAEAPAPGRSAKTKARPRRRGLKGALLVLAVASAAGAAFALNGTPAALNNLTSLSFDRAPDALKQLPSIVLDRAQGLLKRAPAVGPAGRHEESNPARLKGAHFEETPVNSVSPAGSRTGDSRPAAPQASTPVRDRPAEPPSENALIATPVAPAAVGAPPAAQSIKSAAEPGPTGADGSSGGVQPSGYSPPVQQSDKPSIAGDSARPRAVALEAMPLPPIRPATLRRRAKHEKAPRPHKVADEPQAPAEPPAPQPEKTDAVTRHGGPANPLLRAMSNAFR